MLGVSPLNTYPEAVLSSFIVVEQTRLEQSWLKSRHTTRDCTPIGSIQMYADMNSRAGLCIRIRNPEQLLHGQSQITTLQNFVRLL